MAVLAALYGADLPRQRLVPDQSPGGRHDGVARERRRRPSWRASTRTALVVATVIHAVMSLLVGLLYARPAADGPAATRFSSAGLVVPLLVDRPDLGVAPHRQSDPRRAHRLAVVRRLADRLRHRRGAGRVAAGRRSRRSSTCRSRCARGSSSPRRTASGERARRRSWRCSRASCCSPAATRCRAGPRRPTGRCARTRCATSRACRARTARAAMAPRACSAQRPRWRTRCTSRGSTTAR